MEAIQEYRMVSGFLQGPIAQRNRASDYGSLGREFESLWGRVLRDEVLRKHTAFGAL